jgi:tetratricopeptide (TPR) repeat protein
VARALGVRFILHGSVQSDGDFIRICASLTHADNAADIWAQRFDGNSSVSSLFSIQEDIAQKVIAPLGDNFGPIHRVMLKEFQHEHNEYPSPDNAVLHYKRWITSMDPGLFNKAKASLEQSVEHYPDSASCLALLAEIYASDYQMGFDSVPDALNLAMHLSKAAQRMDINCQGAYWSEALVHYLRRDREQFKRTIEQVLPLNPVNPFMAVSVSLLLGLSGQIARASEMMDRAIHLSPYSPRWYHIIPFMTHYMREEYTLALSEALQINVPTCFWDPLLRTIAYGHLGRHNEAYTAYAELLRIEPLFVERQKRLLQGLFLSDSMLKKVLTSLNAIGLLKTT